MAIFNQMNAEVYIADYQHLGVYVCRIIVPEISDIYPVDDLHIANNAMAIDLRDTIMSLADSQWPKRTICGC